MSKMRACYDLYGANISARSVPNWHFQVGQVGEMIFF